MHSGVLCALALLFVPIFAGCLSADLPTTTGPEEPVNDDYRIPPGTGGMADEEAIGLMSQEIIFGGSPKHALTRVLLIPPQHGDAGNPTGGASFQEYLDVTLYGIREWLTAIELFVEDHPEYRYLLDIDIEIEVFDGQVPPSTVGYDIVSAFVESGGPAFRGLATQVPVDVQSTLDDLGIGEMVHWGNRIMVMSLFSSAPRAGQNVPDYPELNDMESVTMHEFAHVWGIGHTTTWTEQYGPDLMNSPYGWVYGDGLAAGDGGIRTPLTCVSTLNLYALAYVYSWLPDGEWQSTVGSVDLPSSMEYKLYCRNGTYNVTNVGNETA